MAVSFDHPTSDELVPPAWLDEADAHANGAANDSREPESLEPFVLPPGNIPAEETVISNVLSTAGECIEHIEDLRPEHFSSEAWRQTFASCRELHAEGQAITIITVAERLRATNRLAQVGGISELTRVEGEHAILPRRELRAHVEIILDASRRRAQIFLAHKVIAQAQAGGAQADVSATIAQLASLHDRGTLRHFAVLDAAEIWAPLPPVEFVIAGMMPRGSLGMVCATGSSLKTWAVLDLVIACASGAKWLGRFGCAQGRALFVDWESGEDEVRRRLQRLSAKAVDGVSLLTMPDVFFNSPDFEAVVFEWAKAYRLIALDSLAAGTIDVDENDARFAQGLRILKRVAAKTGCVIVVLHHNRKGRTDGDGDERDAPRGSSAIFAACDVVLSLARADDGAFRVVQTKARGGKAGDPFTVRVDDLEGGLTVVRAVDAPACRPKTADARFSDLRERIVAAARKHPDLPGRSLLERVDGSDKPKWTALGELLESGRLVNLGSEARPKLRVGVLRKLLRSDPALAAVSDEENGEALRNGSQHFDRENTDES